MGGRVGRRDACEKCGTDLHCCRNCQFYDRASYNECSEPMADRIVEKEKGNFCDFFQLSTKKQGSVDKTAEAKKKLEELFRKKT